MTVWRSYSGLNESEWSACSFLEVEMVDWLGPPAGEGLKWCRVDYCCVDIVESGW